LQLLHHKLLNFIKMKTLSRDEMKKIVGGYMMEVCPGHGACSEGNRCCWVQGNNWGYGHCGQASNCCEEAC
jgi:hypothetical protein